MVVVVVVVVVVVPVHGSLRCLRKPLGPPGITDRRCTVCANMVQGRGCCRVVIVVDVAGVAVAMVVVAVVTVMAIVMAMAVVAVLVPVLVPVLALALAAATAAVSAAAPAMASAPAARVRVIAVRIADNRHNDWRARCLKLSRAQRRRGNILNAPRCRVPRGALAVGTLVAAAAAAVTRTTARGMPHCLGLLGLRPRVAVVGGIGVLRRVALSAVKQLRIGHAPVVRLRPSAFRRMMLLVLMLHLMMTVVLLVLLVVVLLVVVVLVVELELLLLVMLVLEVAVVVQLLNVLKLMLLLLLRADCRNRRHGRCAAAAAANPLDTNAAAIVVVEMTMAFRGHTLLPPVLPMMVHVGVGVVHHGRNAALRGPVKRLLSGRDPRADHPHPVPEPDVPGPARPAGRARAHKEARGTLAQVWIRIGLEPVACKPQRGHRAGRHA
jgi:hypothetical protein